MAINPAMLKSGRKFSKLFGRGIFYWFRLGIFSIFLAFILFNSIITGIESGSIGAVFLDLGERFLNPFKVAIAESETMIMNSPDLNSWDKFLTFGSFFFAIYSVFLWLRVISKFIVSPLLKDTNPLLIRSILTFMIFFGVQIIYLLLTEQELSILVDGIKSIKEGVVYIIKSIAGFAEKVSPVPKVNSS